MSHFAFYSSPAPVETRHGDVYVGLGESDGGDESVSIVCHDSDRHDIHLSARQAVELTSQLCDCIAAMTEKELAS